MKKIVWLLALILLYANMSWAGDRYKVSATITSLGYANSSSELLEVPMQGEAGDIVALSCWSDLSDDYTVYVIDTWYSESNDVNAFDRTGTTAGYIHGWWYDQTSTCVENENLLVFDYASPVTSFSLKDVRIPFQCDDADYERKLFLGAYNADPSATATIRCEFDYELKQMKTNNSVADTD